jgi:6-pyruvoyltetrahydropterin/6-carboxytetrahydropterin synthase
MYEVSVQATFSAAHRVRLPDGRLEPPHGHDWQVRISFRGEQLDAAGFLVDFVAAQRVLDDAVGRLHHTDLNECPTMKGLNPSAENVARVIYDLIGRDPGLRPLLSQVRVTEAPGCNATYGPASPLSDT